MTQRHDTTGQRNKVQMALHTTERFFSLFFLVTFYWLLVTKTGNARDEYRKLAQDAGMDDFLTKPYNKAEIHQKIEKWVSTLVKQQEEEQQRERHADGTV